MVLFAALIFVSVLGHAQGGQMVKVVVEPPEASIYVDGVFSGYGTAQFRRPKKKGVVVLRFECSEYNSINATYSGTDKRRSLKFTLQQDGFYRSSAASGVVNKFFTVDIDTMYYKISEEGKIDLAPAWKMIHQILLNYFDEFSSSDFYGGYIQTTWQYKTFNIANKQIRNRVTVRDISTPDRVAFQIKVDSEVASSMAARHGEFTAVDRIPKEFEGILQELQTRIGKVHSAN